MNLFPRINLAQALGEKASKELNNSAVIFHALNNLAVIVKDCALPESIICDNDGLTVMVKNLEFDTLLNSYACIALNHHIINNCLDPKLVNLIKDKLKTEIKVFIQAYSEIPV